MENSALTSLKFDKSPYQITLSYADFGILVKVLSTHVLEKIGIKTFIILFHMNCGIQFCVYVFINIGDMRNCNVDSIY